MVYEGGHQLFYYIPSGESDTVVILEHDWHEHLTALNESKQLVWEADITWDQLQEMGYLVVIQPESPTPTPQSTPGGT